MAEEIGPSFLRRILVGSEVCSPSRMRNELIYYIVSADDCGLLLNQMEEMRENKLLPLEFTVA